MLFTIPIPSAVAAQREFGQPLVYGILAQRGVALIAVSTLLTYQALATNVITLGDIERSLLVLAWITLTLYFAMHLFFDPSSYYYEYGAGFVTSPVSGDATFAFDAGFIIYALYYYGFKALR